MDYLDRLEELAKAVEDTGPWTVGQTLQTNLTVYDWDNQVVAVAAGRHRQDDGVAVAAYFAALHPADVLKLVADARLLAKLKAAWPDFERAWKTIREDLT